MLSEIHDFYAISQLGGEFLKYGVREMLRLIRPNEKLDSEVMFWMLYSAANRHDRQACMTYLRDWDIGKRFRKKVTKFRPGIHWHALDKKFSTYNAAVQYIKSCGYDVDGVEEVYAPRDGD